MIKIVPTKKEQELNQISIKSKECDAGGPVTYARRRRANLAQIPAA